MTKIVSNSSLLPGTHSRYTKLSVDEQTDHTPDATVFPLLAIFDATKSKSHSTSKSSVNPTVALLRTPFSSKFTVRNCTLIKSERAAAVLQRRHGPRNLHARPRDLTRKASHMGYHSQ